MSILSKLNFTWENFSQREEVIALSISPAYAYENGKRTETIDGYTMEVVLPDLGFEKLRIKVSEKPKFEQADIDASSTFAVKFEGFSAKFYIIDGHERVSAKAERCISVANDLFSDYKV